MTTELIMTTAERDQVVARLTYGDINQESIAMLKSLPMVDSEPAEQAIKDAREQVMEEVIQCVNSERGSSTDNLILALRELLKKSTPMQGVVTSERIAAAYNAVNTRLTDARKQTL